jgi:ribosomal-protein-serine acetyltransferase
MHVTRWPPVDRPGEILRAPCLELHRWRPEDAADLLAVVRHSREHLVPWMPWALAYDDASAADYTRGCETAWAERDHFDYRLASPDGSVRILGSASLMARLGPGALEIGYWVHVDHVGRGLATRAAAALTVAGLSIPGVRRVEIHHDVGNVASGRIPARLGYTRAGEYVRIPGNPEGIAAQACGTLAVWVLTAEELAGSPAVGLAAAR